MAGLIPMNVEFESGVNDLDLTGKSDFCFGL